ncbi:MAG: pilus (MSHA type) biogenesis protein MshL [Gammaproteobacteria bacterium]|nr:pilus (MSHA type) biogenesis protein MshL [Gammaproteobacteria bacterium]MDH5728267.1 pilus (MSHA type) biogenesis protein MshL [Gammaproteobacteria bacterium]
MTLSACELMPVAKGEKDLQQTISSTIAEAGEQQKQAELAVPPQVQRALLPPIRLHRQAQQSQAVLPKRFDFNAVDADVRQVYLNLFEGAGSSLVLHPDVSGQVSLQLKNTTLDEAMRTLRDVYGYEYEIRGQRYYVLGSGLQTRVYPVNYLSLQRKGQSDLRVTSSGLVNNENGSAPNGIQLQTESESNFWKQLQENLIALVGKEGGRAVITNPQASLVVVRALPTELRLIDEFLGMTQNTLNRQVVLEAKILEVELNDSFQAGINWSNLLSANGFSLRTSQVAGGSLPANGGVSGIAGNTANLATSQISNSTATAFGGIFSVALKINEFSSFAEVLETQGKVQVLSSPRVSTLNNQKAVIKVGGDEYFVTGVSSSTSTSGATTTQTPSIDLTPFFSGIALDVTPQIDAMNNIILHMHPTISEVSQKEKSFVIGDQSFSIPLAFSVVQESDNVVRAQTGQVVVIGGLMKEAVSDESASIPLLGQIPYLGYLFKHKRMSRIKKELVILLKPTVVAVNGDPWPQMAGESQRHFDTINSLVRQ